MPNAHEGGGGGGEGEGMSIFGTDSHIVLFNQRDQT